MQIMRRETFRYLLTTSIGIIFLLLVIYSRLHLRIPRDLPLTLTEDNIIFYLYIFCNVLIIFLVNVFNYKKKNDSTNNIIKDLNVFYEQILFATFDFIDSFIWIWYKTRLTLIAEKYFYNMFKNNKNQYLGLYIGINCIPRIIVIFLFLLDIFYFQRFHYFYIALILLLIPLIFHMWMYCISQYFSEALKGIENDVIISVIGIVP